MSTAKGRLSVVSTPIGNLSDITFRAIFTLKEADVILCEDTRVTKKLLDHYEIRGKQLSAWNEEKSGVRIERIIGWLEDGKHVALVADAGTPGISDPGALLIGKVKKHFPIVQSQGLDDRQWGVTIETVPGPSALAAAISISGIPMHEFTFLGFLPHKKGRETLFKEIAGMERSAIFYESPHRILKALESLQKFAPEKLVTICRELTKIHEEVVSGTAEELLKFFEENEEKVRGEMVVIISVPLRNRPQGG